METDAQYDAWSAGQSYDHYMGRWSGMIAAEFVAWLSAPEGSDWLEIGCGTGALTASIVTYCAPRSIHALDQSAEFVAHARNIFKDTRVTFATADAQMLPADDSSIDVVTSALVLNFVPDKAAALAEMRRVLRPDGLLSFYVWDYPGGGMGFIEAFWKAAAALDPKAADLDESCRFPFCTPNGLTELCRNTGLADVTVAPIEVEAAFPDFDAFWHPFTLGAGPAPGYCMSLPEGDRTRLRARLAETLGTDGVISLPARSWAVKCQVSQ